jgi:dTDP-4-dehydrorhamnose reductase
MNVALVGSSGYISSSIIERFKNEREINRVLKLDQTLDADEYINLLEPELFDYNKLDIINIVIFTAAISGPDKCATEFDFCWKVNVEGTIYFIRKAIEHNCKVIFFSSDAVFGDIQGVIYDESSETKANTPYGKMKKAVEDEFKFNALFKCIRLSYVASIKDRFITYCLSCIDRKETAVVFHPFYRNCIVVSDVVNVVCWLMYNWSKYPYFSLNVAGKELVSRVRIADEVNRILNNRLVYTISYPNEEFYLNRPKITQMKSLYLHKFSIIDDNTFTEKIQSEFKNE